MRPARDVPKKRRKPLPSQGEDDDVSRGRREAPPTHPDVLPARPFPSTPGLGCGGGRRLVGFSAFPDGGRFEALFRTGPGEEESAAVQVRGREGVCRRGVTRCGARVREREGPRARGGAAAGGRAEVTVFPSRCLGCSGAERWPRGPRRDPRPVRGGAACSRAPGRRKPLFLPSPRPPRSAHTSSLTHFAAQAVIWRQR